MNYQKIVDDVEVKDDTYLYTLKTKYIDFDYIPKVVAIINSNPSNPLGTYLGESEKERLIKIDPVRGENLSKNLERPLMAIPLVAHEALTTAYINDVDGLGVFAQQLYGFGKKNDVFLGISTSGNSQNVMSATVVARALGIKVLGLTGELGGELNMVSNVCVKVPETETYRIQELHLPVYHCWCLMLEDHFFGANA